MCFGNGRRMSDSFTGYFYNRNAFSLDNRHCHGNDNIRRSEMFVFLYEWIRNVAFYIVIITAIIQILPNDTYKKYIHFFTGLVLILLLMTPLLKILGMDNLSSPLRQERFEQKLEEIEKETQYLQEVQFEDYLHEKNIEVEEVEIGVESK